MLEFTSPEYYWQNVSYTGTIQAKRPDGTPHPYPRVRVHVYREDWRLRYDDRNKPIKPLNISMFQFGKFGDKNGNIIFQVSKCSVLTPHFI